MSITTIGLIVLVACVVLLLFRMPVGFILFFGGLLGVMLVRGFGPATSMMGHRPFDINLSFGFSAVPMFILMGHLTYASGVSQELFNAARAWAGHLKGGLVIATTLANAAFGACCGSSTAACAVFGRVAVPEMLRTGVDRKLAVGTVASAGMLSALIPPSVLIIVYGVIAQQSIAKLLIAGILPGVFSALVYCVMIWTRARINPKLAPPLTGITWGQRIHSVKGVWGVSALFLLVIGGIFSGWFTPTEGGAIGAMGAFILVLVKKRLSRTVLKESFSDTARTTAIVFICVTGAMIMTMFLAFSGIAGDIATWVFSLDVAPVVIVIGCIVLFIALGTIMDPVSTMMLTMPIILPFIDQLGIEHIWFGILVVKTTEIGMITPPMGLNVFMLHSVLPDIPIGEIFRGCGWFLVTEVAILAFLIAFPQITQILPNLMFR